MSVFPKLICRVHAVPVKIQVGFFCRKFQAERKGKRSRRAKTPWKMKGKVREFMLPDFKSYYKTTIKKTMCCLNTDK